MFRLLLAATATIAQLTTTPTPAPTIAPVATAINLTVSSLVKMGSSGASIPIGVPVTLHLLRATENSGTTEPVTESATLSADNATAPIHFAPFAATVGDICVLTVSYQGITQGSAPYTIQASDATLDLPITLYDQTTDPASVRISATSQTLHFAPGNLVAVLETVDWVASGDRFFLSKDKTPAGDPISVQLTLPVGARAVAFSTQPVRRFVIGGNANMPSIEDTAPVIPGLAHRVVFSYQVPYTQGAYIDRDYPYAVDQLSILVPDEAHVQVAGLSGSTFGAQTNTTLDPQRPYTEYTLKGPIKAGGRLVYTLSGAPQVVVAPGQVPTPDNGPGIGLIVVIGGVLLLVAVVGLWLLRLALLRRADT